MTAWEIGCLATMLISCTLTVWLSRRQGLARQPASTGPVTEAEQRLTQVIEAAGERQNRMLQVIARAERAVALQGALRFGDAESPLHSFRDAERLLAGGIPIDEVAERLALPRPEVELLSRIRGFNGARSPIEGSQRDG